MNDERNDRDRTVASAALALVAEHGGWTAVPLAAITERAGLSAEEAQQHFPCKASCLAAIMRDADAQVSAVDMTFEEDDTARDRLFAVLMNRIDVLGRNRESYPALLRDIFRDPVSMLLLAPTLHKSMRRMLDLAGIGAPGDTSGPVGGLCVNNICNGIRAKGLAAVWLSALRAWLADDSEDLAATMAALDRSLQRAEALAGMLSPAAARRNAPDPA